MTSRRPHLLRRGSPRRLAAVAVVCLLAQLAGVLHLLVVRHERCAEHGEVVHAGDEASAHDAAVAGDARALAVRPAADDAEHDDHEHCQALSDRRAVGAPSAPAIAGADLTAGDGTAVADAAPARAGVLYRLAPKLSPPRTA